MKNFHRGFKFLALVLCLSLVMPLSIVSAATAPTTTEIRHESPDSYIPGFRINLEAEIEDDAGVLVARCYFKTKKDENFVFRNMTAGEEQTYSVTLPAPWVDSEAVEYLLVVVNQEKQVVRSQMFTIEEEETEQAAVWKDPSEVKEIRLDVVQETVEEYEVVQAELVENYGDQVPKWQGAADGEVITVQTELGQPGAQIHGFYDTFVVTETADSAKYGLLAEGLYTEGAVASAGGASAITASTGAVSAGMIEASGGSNAGWIALGAVVAGGAVAAGSGGGGGGGGGGGSSTVTITTPCDSVATAGGDDAETHIVNLGQTSGSFQFDWEMFVIKDRMRIFYEGSKIYDTGCVSGSGSDTISFNGSSKRIEVRVKPNCEGTVNTSWNFRVGCP